MLNDFREKVNLSLYNSKNAVLSLFRWLHIIIALSMMGVLTYYYGFPQTEESQEFLIRIIEFSFLFYIIRYFVKLIYDYNLFHYIRSNWLETIIVALLIVEGVSYNLFGIILAAHFFESIGFEGFAEFSNLTIQLFFVAYIFMEIFKKRDFRQYFKIHPGLLFTLSILGIILIGTGMLMLPEMTQDSYNISFIDSLFISTSSTSVTGLATIDIANILTFKGQIVVLFLIQVGALNTIAFAALYLLIAKFGIGIKQHDVIEDFVNNTSFLDTETMFYKIVKWTLAIEFLGFVCVFILLEPAGMFADTSDRIFHSLFHSISSFCNAGLTTIPNGLMNALVVDNYLLHGVTLGLFFLGGFGMIYLFDIFGVQSLRKRMKYPWKTLRFDTKITLYTTLFLLVLGAAVFYIFEYDRSLEGKSGFGALITTLFHSMTTRNAGFSTVDISALSLPVIVFFLFLMFVGASSGSSGGGIRVSTFAIMVSSVVSTIKRKPHVELFKRTIDNELVLKAYSIFVFFVVGNLIGIFALLVTEYQAIEAGKFMLIDIIFEHVSAASTVGLSTGITAELSEPGKIVLIIAMFVGRVGTLTIAYLFGKQVMSRRYKYPKGHTMIG
ncbi:TrkH family potassium uptake protein [Brumimicrobium oceani]|uniref:ATPase n=1 Tax=Brumimicrobium oceani TaxID=2100725 RepID=A0A2U2X353_9FLAO|nr:potassium transporter TrkG [Brumimicrobium oceani]PWH82207.1 ATPase [Brumimicrobium oceani]